MNARTGWSTLASRLDRRAGGRQADDPAGTGRSILAGISRLGLVVAVLAVGHACVVVAEESHSPAAIKAMLDVVSDDLAAERPTAAREQLKQAVAAIAELSHLDKPPAAVRSLVERARSLRDELELQGGDAAGIEIPSPGGGRSSAAAVPERAAEKKPPARRPTAGSAMGKSNPARKGPMAKGKGPTPGSAPAGVSFVNQVAPLLVRHCGGCHVAGNRGEFQFSSHETLMKTGMVQKGAGADSRLVEVIRTGDMPRGGGKVSPEECALLVKWIDEGASFDGGDAAATLGGNAAAPVAVAVPAGPVALEPGDVSFAFEVAPLLVRQCAGCHDATQPDGNLSMVSLESLLRGGRNGAPALAGEGAASLLVRKLKGVEIEGQRMPLGKTPLTDDEIAKIEKWIDQGTKLDLLSAQSPLETVAAAGRARSLSHEELLAARFEAVDGVWRRAIADEDPAVVTRGDLRLVGNIPESRLESLADATGKVAKEVAEQLGLPGRALAKGGVVLIAFDKPYDYSAFWENVLGDERPKGLTGSAGVSGDVLYGALVAPDLDSAPARADAEAMLAEELTAAAFLARGTPDWFASAAGRALAAKVSPKSTLAKAWRAEATERVHSMRRPVAVVEGSANPTDTAIVGGAFLTAASGGTARLKGMIAVLDDGVPFEKAFTDVYQGPPAAVFEAWLAREGKKRGGNGGR